jgi:hypothetical protein
MASHPHHPDKNKARVVMGLFDTHAFTHRNVARLESASPVLIIPPPRGDGINPIFLEKKKKKKTIRH